MPPPLSSSCSPRKPSPPIRFASLASLTSLILLSLLGGGAYFSFHFSNRCTSQYVLSSFSSLCSQNPASLPSDRQILSPPPSPRPYTDDELAALAFSRDVLHQPRSRPKRPKIAFMFLTRSQLLHERLWEQFFQLQRR